MNFDDLPLEDSPYLLDNYGPIFILGCPRSGTTFLSKCVSAIPGVREFVGVLVPPRMMHLIGSPDSQPVRSQLLFSARDVFWQAFWRRIYFRSENLALLAQKSITVRDFLAKPNMDSKFFCYKEPFLCFSVLHFANHFPNSKFIHIIRDGRDNADSMERTYRHALSNDVLTSQVLSNNKVSEIGNWRTVNAFNYPWWLPIDEEEAFQGMTQYGRCIRLWREMVSRACVLKTQLPPSRYFEIKYEDFVSFPIEYGSKIREFIGAPNSKQFKERLAKAFQSSINVSKKNQNVQKFNEASAIAGNLLAELGYKI